MLLVYLLHYMTQKEPPEEGNEDPVRREKPDPESSMEEDQLGAKCFYNKAKCFFDNISSELKSRYNCLFYFKWYFFGQ